MTLSSVIAETDRQSRPSTFPPLYHAKEKPDCFSLARRCATIPGKFSFLDKAELLKPTTPKKFDFAEKVELRDNSLMRKATPILAGLLLALAVAAMFVVAFYALR